MSITTTVLTYFTLIQTTVTVNFIYLFIHYTITDILYYKMCTQKESFHNSVQSLHNVHEIKA
jgi:hypothetical protein